MPIFFYTFTIGLVGVVGVMGLKYVEIKTGRPTFLARLELYFERLALRIESFIGFLKLLFSWRSFVHFLIIFIHALVVIWNRLRSALVFQIKKIPHSRKIVEAVRGRYELTKRREASDYLRKIEDTREI